MKMAGLIYPGRNAVIAWIIFSCSLVAAIACDQPLIGLAPFVWISLPVLERCIIQKPSLLFWALIALLPLSTEWQVTASLGLDFPDEPLLILLTGIVFLKLLHQPRWFPEQLAGERLFVILTIYVLWISLTCISSEEPLFSIKYLLAKTWYLIPFVLLPQVLIRNRNDIGKIAKMLLVPMLLVVLQTLIRHGQYGFAFDKVQKTLSPFFRNHVNYSSMLVCLLPVGAAMYMLCDKKNMRRWIGVGLLIGLIGIVFAYSRGAWLALLAGIAAVWVIRKKWMKGLIITASFLVFISTAWLITDNRYMRFAPDHDHTIFHTDFNEHLQATLALKDVSNAERFYRWIAGVRMLAQKPITGFGPNSFYGHYRPYTIRRFETWVSNNPEHSTVHNYFILLALEQGFPGLALFCILYFAMLVRLQHLYHRFQSRFYRITSITVAVILVMIGVINSLSDMIETDKIGSLFWLCLGMVIVLQQKEKEERELLA